MNGHVLTSELTVEQREILDRLHIPILRGWRPGGQLFFGQLSVSAGMWPGRSVAYGGEVGEAPLP